MSPERPAVGVRVTPRAERPPFPNYTELPIRTPLRVWLLARLVVLAAGLALCAVLLIDPDTGLTLFWGLLVPMLPIIWVAAPGLWRNLCPLATSNQVPRMLRFTRAAKAPPVVTRFAYVFGIAAFLVLMPARKVLFNDDGTATAILLFVALCAAFAGGVVFGGKSGWCSTVCPLLPVQRLYGETPFLLVRNSHCEPCVGCAKNCYDFNPRVAKLADLDDDDPRYAAPRRFFAAMYPGLILGFFSMANVPQESTAWVCGRIALYIAASVALYAVAETFFSISAHQLTALFAAVALNAFYWYAVPTLVDTIGGSPHGTSRAVVIWAGRAMVLGLTVPWLVRTLAKEQPFHAATSGAAQMAPAGLAALRDSTGGDPSVTFHPDGPEVGAREGTPLLDVIEDAGLGIEAGCRLGVCGSDPIAILDGASSLSPVTRDESSTLGRLGLADNTRLACQARVHGACTICLTPDRAAPDRAAPEPAFTADPNVRRLVIVGNGIAGATAADHARRLHPDCEIHVVGMEPHRFYNRMAISRLVYGRSAMQGLYLLPDDWFDDHHVTCWLNTRVRALDPETRTVALATGTTLAYDRIVLAPGSRPVVPDIPGIGLSGSFTMRDADEAIAIRAYVQRHDVPTAVVSGGGVLGVESAYALHQLGLDTMVLERGPWLLRRQLDEPAAQLLERYLEALGITVVTNASCREVTGGDRVEGIILEDGRVYPCGVFVTCAGMTPAIELARDAGLAVNRGIIVDTRMRTSDPRIYAAGDVAEFEGGVVGLWPSSAYQGEVAAVNAVGGDAEFVPTPPTTLLKVAGIDVASLGEVDAAGPNDLPVSFEDEEGARYRKLVVRDGQVVGAILVGHPLDLPAVQQAVEERRDVSTVLDRLRSGDWSVLEGTFVS